MKIVEKRLSWILTLPIIISNLNEFIYRVAKGSLALNKLFYRRNEESRWTEIFPLSRAKFLPDFPYCIWFRFVFSSRSISTIFAHLSVFLVNIALYKVFSKWTNFSPRWRKCKSFRNCLRSSPRNPLEKSSRLSFYGKKKKNYYPSRNVIRTIGRDSQRNSRLCDLKFLHRAIELFKFQSVQRLIDLCATWRNFNVIG